MGTRGKQGVHWENGLTVATLSFPLNIMTDNPGLFQLAGEDQGVYAAFVDDGHFLAPGGGGDLPPLIFGNSRNMPELTCCD